MTQHPPIMHLISLGAGVQSTTMALMAAHGAIEPLLGGLAVPLHGLGIVLRHARAFGIHATEL